MDHWLLNTLEESRLDALQWASIIQIHYELFHESLEVDYEFIQRTAEVLEMVVFDYLLDGPIENEDKLRAFKSCAADAFRLFRVIPRSEDALETSLLLLRCSALAVLGDIGSDASRLLSKFPWPDLPIDSENWSERTWATIVDIWLRLIRKQGWLDRDIVLERISVLRNSQSEFEKNFLESQSPSHSKSAALELIGLYHLAKAAEILAYYITDGVVGERNYQIKELLETHFDRVLAACRQAQMVNLEPLAQLLSACALQMAENSIWTVTRAVNSRVTKFVESLVERGRGNQAIFDVLPPQRYTLAEKGLLGSSRRAVVVSLPTSSGKTLIAEFRILQALNQFDQERGWVAYIVPTRALVNQISRRLRRDFAPLNIVVEQVSPALEIDSIERNLLHENEPQREFRVLVTTPEKLDLMLRQGLEETIQRPLALVVVDEAHNIQSTNRGLKLELLLATINNECRQAQFLLLTPFIINSKEVAQWLGGTNSDDINLSIDWQPNDRVIGVVRAERGEEKGNHSFDYSLHMETVHTTRNTLTIDDTIVLPNKDAIASTYSKVTNQSTLAAVTAQHLSERGPVIVMHSRPDWVWSLAEKLKIDTNKKRTLSDKVQLVQQFLELEYGDDFPLINLLSYGIGVHHGGLSDDVRTLMEWLFEEDQLEFLVATTTIAQGVNFPVTGVVMASHQYPYGKDMPPEDFWNIAGRAGRIGQGNLGIVALVAENEEKANELHVFINQQAGDLNSALIELAAEAEDSLGDLEGIVYRYPSWSTFVQYLSHTYRQMGNPEGFAEQIEQVLRGTFGFKKLRMQNRELANRLLDGVYSYIEYLQKPGQPLKLVDSTGFSLQSIKTVLAAADGVRIRDMNWNPDILFSHENRNLQGMMGVLLKIPELRENLEAVTGGNGPNGRKLALIVKDWVNGVTVRDIAIRYFLEEGDSITKAITNCGKNLFGRLTQTASWGLGALLSIAGSDMSEDELEALNNLPSRVFYGVNDDSAIALRLLGVPRIAATPLARYFGNIKDRPLIELREELKNLDAGWVEALGQREGRIYQRVWQVLEGLE